MSYDVNDMVNINQVVCNTTLPDDFDNLLNLAMKLKKDKVSNLQKIEDINRFLKHKARKDSTPILGSFEITPYCNLNCSMCYVHSSNSNCNVLRYDFWRNIIDEASEAGMFSAQITGGECLTHPDFIDIFHHLRSKGINPAILTNGALIDKNWVSFFKDNNPLVIQVSLYGSNDDAYEKTTGHRVFHKVMSGIENLQAAGVSVKIAVTISRPMISDLKNLFTLLYNLKVPFEYSCDLIPPYEGVDHDFSDIRLTIDEKIDIHRIIAESSGSDIIKTDEALLPYPQSHIYCEVGEGMPCGSGRSSFSINWKGDLLPCNAIGFVRESLLTTCFTNAWAKINNWALNHKVIQNCYECYYKPICRRCPIMHELCTGVVGATDTSFCDMLRLCVAEGVMSIEKP